MIERVSTSLDFNTAGNYVFKGYADGTVDITYQTIGADGQPNHMSITLTLKSKEAEILRDFIIGVEAKNEDSKAKH